jgi:hypothetical protein
MSNHNPSRSPIVRRIFHSLGLLTLVLSAGCQALTNAPTNQSPTPTPASVSTPSVITTPLAQVTFQVTVPAQTPNDAGVVFSILDEVTGLPYNTTSYRMKSIGAKQYEIQLPFLPGSVITYRYELDGNPRTGEYTAGGDPVRYRMGVVSGPQTLQDVVSAWKDVKYSGDTGQISGKVVDSQSSSPLPGLIVSAGGLRTTSAPDGSFTLAGLPTGTHNLVVIAQDGRIHPFQQGAKVVAAKVTQATVPVKTVKTVNVTFSVKLPKENVVGLPVRLAGNLAVLGDTFTDLAGGVSVQASRTPLLAQKPDGSYSIALSLPVGADLRYKYTLGDGFWNAELSSDGRFKVRQLIVPDHDTTIQDTIETWRSPNLAPVTFDIQAPPNTPAGETVSIQFSPYVWMEPLPMWSMGNNRWVYILFGPQHLLGQVKYRFCRNDQCENAGANVDGASGEPRFTPNSQPQNIQKTISSWIAWQPSDEPSPVAAASIQPRGPGFTAGVEMDAAYQPAWFPYLPHAFQTVRSIGANWIYLTPSWKVMQSGDAPFFLRT